MYRVIKRFNDRYTGERYEVGDEYKPDGKEAAGRVDHLIARGFVEEARSARAGQAGTTPESASVRARADAVEDDDECAPDSSTDE